MCGSASDCRSLAFQILSWWVYMCMHAYFTIYQWDVIMGPYYMLYQCACMHLFKHSAIIPAECYFKYGPVVVCSNWDLQDCVLDAQVRGYVIQEDLDLVNFQSNMQSWFGAAYCIWTSGVHCNNNSLQGQEWQTQIQGEFQLETFPVPHLQFGICMHAGTYQLWSIIDRPEVLVNLCCRQYTYKFASKIVQLVPKIRKDTKTKPIPIQVGLTRADKTGSGCCELARVS